MKLKHKKITKSCGVTIPKDIRHEAGLLPGMAVDVVTTGNGVTIQKHVPACHICGNAEGVVSYMDFDLCTACLAVFNEEAQKIENE